MNILITGGASGLGAAITAKLAGVTNGVVYFTYNSSQDKAQKIEAAYKNCRGIKCDFSDDADCEALCKKIESMDLEVLVNNAYSGPFIQAHFHKTPGDGFLNSFKNNILPTISITQAALDSMRKRKIGKIITVLSAALIGNPATGSSVYTANKAYLEQLTKAWAVENIKFNITSNSISPSFMLTGFADNMDERLVEQMRENHPLKKFLTPQEVAETVGFMVQSSQHMNGVNIVLNAGMSIK